MDRLDQQNTRSYIVEAKTSVRVADRAERQAPDIVYEL